MAHSVFGVPRAPAARCGGSAKAEDSWLTAMVKNGEDRCCAGQCGAGRPRLPVVSHSYYDADVVPRRRCQGKVKALKVCFIVDTWCTSSVSLCSRKAGEVYAVRIASKTCIRATTQSSTCIGLQLPLSTFRSGERCVVSPGAVWRAYDAFIPCAKNRTVFMLLFLAVSKRSSSGSRLTLPTTPDPTWYTQSCARITPAGCTAAPQHSRQAHAGNNESASG